MHASTYADVTMGFPDAIAHKTFSLLAKVFAITANEDGSNIAVSETFPPNRTNLCFTDLLSYNKINQLNQIPTWTLNYYDCTVAVIFLTLSFKPDKLNVGRGGTLKIISRVRPWLDTIPGETPTCCCMSL